MKSKSTVTFSLQILTCIGIKSNPREIAASIVANVPQNDLVQKVCQYIKKSSTVESCSLKLARETKIG